MSAPGDTADDTADDPAAPAGHSGHPPAALAPAPPGPMPQPNPGVTPSPWQAWRAATPARLALGRAGSGMPTDETLRFGWAHAAARDAIHAELDSDALAQALQQQGWAVAQAHSRAADRGTYLRRPDLGRQLAPADAAALAERAAMRVDGRTGAPVEVCLVVGDGLSSLAISRHAVPMLAALRAQLAPDTCFAPVVICRQARVALADEVGELFNARLAVMLIGERPGLSSPDSLGIYLTHTPRRGRHDAQRNCISNVRAAGLSYDAAARRLAWLMREALRLGETGVALKDNSEQLVLDSAATPGALPPAAP